MLGFHLPVLHIDLASTQYNWNVLTYPAQASQSTREHSFRRQHGRQLPTLLVFKVHKPTSLHSKQHAIVKHGGVVLHLITCKDQNAMLSTYTAKQEQNAEQLIGTNLLPSTCFPPLKICTTQPSYKIVGTYYRCSSYLGFLQVLHCFWANISLGDHC
jgi:hypothetical protein